MSIRLNLLRKTTKIARHYKLILFFLIYQGCTGSRYVNKNFDSLKTENVKVSYLNEESNCIRIKRADSNTIVLSFFEEFNDSLKIYENKKQIVGYSIYTINNPAESSGYSGVDCQLRLDNNEDIIGIELVNQKIYVEFTIDISYPLYSVQRYNNVWYVNGRKCMMILK
jgi:hypothetical protein